MSGTNNNANGKSLTDLAAFPVEKLTEEELQGLCEEIEQELKLRNKKRREEVRRQIKQLAREAGISVSVSGRKKRRSGKKDG